VRGGNRIKHGTGHEPTICGMRENVMSLEVTPITVSGLLLCANHP
jgi:hypothetical protein